ncbi:MAG TPA: hypothetical protein VG326_01955 [Tepidisphaeraceae bacterium]|nr:hypothetical protein [Tepidisphaeraceae bacterium]
MPREIRRSSPHALICLALLLACNPLRAGVIWVEGEKPVKSNVKRHPWWYDKVNRDLLSGGDFISNWSDQPGEAEYSVTAPKAGEYDFWTRANPVGAALSYKIDAGAWTPIDLAKGQRDNTNIAADAKPDIRFMAWEHVGKVALRQGANTIAFRFESKNSNHGMLDCFVLSSEDFEPNGITKPGENQKPIAAANEGSGWFAFAPKTDKFEASAIDLRSLNEKQAGDGGFIECKDGQFIHGKTGKPIRFWGVDGPPGNMKDPQELRRCARLLAKYGVNLVRIHAGYYSTDGEIDPDKIQVAIRIVEAMKSEGIYTDFSVYWFNFIAPKPNTPWLEGYDGKKAPIGALIINKDFQKKYESWYTALLTTPSKTTGKRLIDEPAVASLEVQNEDSLFFWSFSDRNLPDEQMRIIEIDFAKWLIKKHGSLDAALKSWKGLRTPRDNPAEGRMGFRQMWNVFHERTLRDQDAVEFLTEFQRDFYKDIISFLRKTGFKGSITTSGWTTASPEYLGALDKYTNTAGDFIDRHGYFGGKSEGPNNGWAVANKQIYADRSALRFDPDVPGKGRLFVNPVMDPHYDGKPSVISETSFDRPNRYRSEGPLYYACYGALQDSNGFDFFAMDVDRWDVKPGYFMQPWTLMAPSTMAQYPAAALMYREGLIATGDLVVNLNLKIGDLEKLHATPMPQDASFDELRAKDVPTGAQLKANSVIDPLVHYAGRTNVDFSETGAPAKLEDLSKYIDRAAQTVTSTTHQLKLDYGKGFLTINAPSAQGLSGNLKDAGTTEMKDMTIASDLELGHIIAVSLDGKPLATSNKILLQVMSEDQPAGFRTQETGNGMKQITDIGHNPWLVKDLTGTVKFKRADAAKLKVTVLDFNGYPLNAIGTANEIKLMPQSVYYLIEP